MIKDDVYSISVRIYLTFRNNLDKPLKAINHSEKTKAKYIQLIPYYLTDYSKETIIAMCLFINFYKKPKSIPSMIKMLVELEKSQITSFKEDIKRYQQYLIQDYKYIKENKINDINAIFNLYIQKKIKFISLYFIIKKLDLESGIKSRIFSSIWQSLKTLMLFLKINREKEEGC